MNNTKRYLNNFGLMIAILFTLFSCDKDFVSTDSDLQAPNNFGTASQKYAVVAYNKMINSVQTSDLPTNIMGIYNDPVFGQTKVNLATQVIPESYSPDFGIEPVLDSVVLTLPYYSTLESTDDDGNNTYTLDSIFGDSPMVMSIYKSNYLLRDNDPTTDNVSTQLYYSNSTAFEDLSNIGELLYESPSVAAPNNPLFIPSADEIELWETNEDTGVFEESSSLAPSLRIKLDNPNGNFWEELFYFGNNSENQPNLSNQNNFTNYFRGLYFSFEPINGQDGSLMMLNLENSGASLTLYYNYKEDEDDPDDDRINDTYSLDFGGIKFSTITKDPANQLVENADASADETNGDEILFLEGNQGSIAVIDLFKDEAVLDDFMSSFKDDNGNPTRLINEANLVFYVNQEAVNAQEEYQEPKRVMIYDLKNSIPLVDYGNDRTFNSSYPIYSIVNHSTFLEEDDNGNGYRYKIRLTEHLNNILLRDSTNYKLGLFISTNVNSIGNFRVPSNEQIDYLPGGSVLSPKGTVLHGSNPNVSEEQRVQLEIFYTEPD